MDDESSLDLEYKIVLLGDTDTGKTELLIRYFNNKDDVDTSTIGIDFRYKDIVKDNKKIRLNIWDIAGQERFKSMQINYLNRAHGIILVFDITNKDTFNIIKYWLISIKEIYPEENVEIIIIANKIDIEDKREISNNSIKEFGEKNNIKIFNTSDKTGEGVEEAFDYLINKIINNKKFENEKIGPNNEFNIRKKTFKLIKRDNNINTNKKNNC